MIRSFGDQRTEDFFNEKNSSQAKKIPADIRRTAQRKLQYLNAACKLSDLAAPPGNRLEALKGDLKGFHSVRINDQWRIIFKWGNGGAFDVRIMDYH
jgi:proteic killer suppression protein